MIVVFVVLAISGVILARAGLKVLLRDLNAQTGKHRPRPDGRDLAIDVAMIALGVVGTLGAIWAAVSV